MFDPVRILETLNDEGVDYVVVGGFAAVIHGSSLPTRDVDIVPAREAENLDRLGRALTRLGAMIRTQGDPVPDPMDGAFLASTSAMLNLVTDCGDVHLVFTSAGQTGGFDGWRRHASEEEVSEGVTAFVASLDDIIDSKRAADRLKDQRALPCLESLRDELGRT
jgi:hypothetical protein